MPISPQRDEFLIADDITLHIIEWGSAGTPVVCIHGLTANAFCYQPLADELAAEHRVIAYDLRGRGDSDKPADGYSVPIHAADLAALIDELELEKPIIIGHSLGALIALHFAAHHPDKLSKLVIIDAGGPLPWNTPEEQPAWLTASISRLGTAVPSFQEYTDRLKMLPMLGPYWNEYIDLYFQHDVLTESDGSVVAKAYREGILEEGLHFDEARPEQQWAYIQVPTLLLRAGQGLFSDSDQLVPEATAAAIQQGIADCQYINYPQLNHYTILFNARTGPAQDIHAFLDQNNSKQLRL